GRFQAQNRRLFRRESCTVVMAGQVGPDGHGGRPHPTDLFYADVDGQWALARDEEGEIFVANPQLPSDRIEMQIGRIDFSDHRKDDQSAELQKLSAYFDKNHHWRNGLHEDLRNGYWDRKHLQVERDGLLNIVGAQGLSKGGHHDIGEEKPWLFGADFGSYKAADYRDFRNKAVFAINFGSHKQRIEQPNNALRATLAQPWYTVAAGWGARPAWRLHHMALGGTIGEAHMRTVNNGEAASPYRESMEYFPTGLYLWRNPIWVNLLGDPTLRAFMFAPPRAAELVRQGNTADLSWAASPDTSVRGYEVYRASSDAAFESIASLDANILTYTDENAPPDARYMIRAKGLKEVPAGSFFTLSQGVFAIADATVVTAPDIELEGTGGSGIPLPLVQTDADTTLMQAPISDGAHGLVTFEDGRWVYTPNEGFTGKDVIRYTSSDHFTTAEGKITLRITPPSQQETSQ
ncbi:MAG: Ig-like domain-containing protein, partial [Litoreibacter sp.]|nr:Ig-like domain-containing protein [Litoreibacter sp.]